ncbi:MULTISPECIES: threonine ammonia-lyase [Actinomadura]|uniref:Threonine/serine dehydratase n=2 Tax=Actinomadura yumaensis TaxID=111807 RepID=A0ABW2CVX0_9ACTN|nr:pyridoxal-phosphate dependent enzyme [Actinomadura sp. J1-007]MWK38607.1 pyridoxal-phosphate dependent enzyme [Actinomadura sp. J1-007]
MTVRAVGPPSRADLDRAWEVVAATLAPTPVVPADALAPGALLKAETFQPTGSFKVRGALAAVAALPPGEPAVTASAGNHGLGMAYAASRSAADVTVVVSTRASRAKTDRIAASPATLVRHGTTYEEAEAHAMGLPGRYVSPYNDPHVISGQATIGCELDSQAAGPLTVVAPLGGGGLVAGLALWARERGDTRVVGVEAAASPAVSTAVRTGAITEVEVGDTIADGLSGNLEPGSVTPGILRAAGTALTSVTEDEIRAAMRWLFAEHGLVVEGSGACGVAAVLAGKIEIQGRLAVVLSGRNVMITTYAEALNTP